MSALFYTFYRRKSGISRFIGDKRRLIGNRSWVSRGQEKIRRRYLCSVRVEFQGLSGTREV
uniref:Uncharacterized protein n=1 Tax=Vitis vinifera TaxID=29760 RepID=F6GZ43_VITVI